MDINISTLVENLIWKGLGIDDYKKIMEDAKRVDVSSNETFQKTFNRFYKVRRNEQWRKAYYELFEDSKNKSDLGFQEIIRNLYQRTNQIEASFSSKILATIKPDMPVWDKYVLNYLDLKLEGKTKNERLDNAIALYESIVVRYEEYLTTDNAKESINLFNSIMPHFQWLTNTKKIDFLIWSIRK